MFVMSEDGTALVKMVGAFTFSSMTAADGWIINATYAGDEDAYGRMASGLSESAAKARLADVVEWLNAPKVLNLGDETRVVDGESVTLPRWQPKPTVYDYGKPIGFWKEAR
jgi:hypothetical protein